MLLRPVPLGFSVGCADTTGTMPKLPESHDAPHGKHVPEPFVESDRDAAGMSEYATSGFMRKPRALAQ
jgi:hypothetical protein